MHFIGISSLPAKFLKRESSVSKNFQKQFFREIPAMNGHDKSRALKMFEDQMGTRLTSLPVTLPQKESRSSAAFGI